MVPDSAGFCIDRMDYLCNYNTNADDGVTWQNGRKARALVESWRELLNQLGPLVHSSNKVIFCNLQDPRLDLARHVDGVYDELGMHGSMVNGAALVCVDKPLLLWTEEEGPVNDSPSNGAFTWERFRRRPIP